MKCPSRRANLFVLNLITTYVSNVLCQNVLLEEGRLISQPYIDSNREIMTTNPGGPNAQLMNTLFSMAAGKNGLPELAAIPPAMIQEKQYATINQNQRPNLCNVVSMSPQTSNFIPKESISVSQPVITTSLPQPAIPTSNIMMGTSIPTQYSASYVQPYQPAIVPAASCSIPIPPKPPQVIPLENYANLVQYPRVWQMPQTNNDFYSFNSQPAVLYTEPTLNSHHLLPCSKNTDSGIYDIRTPGILDVSVPESAVVMNDCEQGMPFNVHINVPSTNMPAPRITLVSTAPPPSVPKPDPFPAYSPFSHPPIIIKNSRSSWKSILPIILIALFSDQDSYGGCCCPCNCVCNSDSPTPIPYPIPIPVNNPIITNAGSSKYSSRKRENTSDEEDDDN